VIEWNTDEGVDGTDPADVAGETLMAAAIMTHDRGDDEAQIVMLPAGGSWADR
jgi:hypothetical protein